MASINPLFARGAASKRIKEAERRLYGDPPKEPGHAQKPGHADGNAPEGLGRDAEAARQGEGRLGREK